MEKPLKKTIFGLGILSLALFTIGEVLFNTVFSGWYFWFFPFLILFFLLINSSFFYFFYRSFKKSGAHFIRSFMATTGAKLVIYMILVLAYLLTSPKSAISFSVTLSVIYVAYSAYDLYIMLGMLKRKKEINTLPNQFSN
jgi:hypothetical protein